MPKTPEMGVPRFLFANISLKKKRPQRYLRNFSPFKSNLTWKRNFHSRWSRFLLKECYQPEIHPTSGFQAVCCKSRRRRRHNSAATSKEALVKENYDHFTHLMMASESCSTSTSSSGEDFVPMFLVRKVMKLLRRIYHKMRSTIRWLKQTRLQLSPMKPKTIRVRLGPVVTYFLGSTFWWQCGYLESIARDRRQDCICCFDFVDCMEKVHSASKAGRHVDLQLSQSSCHCLHDFLH